MGGIPSNMWRTWTTPDVQPDFRKPSTFDPLMGFLDGRKPREMKITQEELEAAKVPHRYRDYCAHLYVDYMKCRQKHAPWYKACKHELHHYEECQYDDWILRMKEYERERRLLIKQKAQQQEYL